MPNRNSNNYTAYRLNTKIEFIRKHKQNHNFILKLENIKTKTKFFSISHTFHLQLFNWKSNQQQKKYIYHADDNNDNDDDVMMLMMMMMIHTFLTHTTKSVKYSYFRHIAHTFFFDSVSLLCQ